MESGHTVYLGTREQVVKLRNKRLIVWDPNNYTLNYWVPFVLLHGMYLLLINNLYIWEEEEDVRSEGDCEIKENTLWNIQLHTNHI